MNKQQADLQEEYDASNKKALDVGAQKEVMIKNVEKKEYNFDATSSPNTEKIEKLEKQLEDGQKELYKLNKAHKYESLKI